MSLIFGSLSGLCIVIGYCIYAWQVVKKENTPNGTTWLMWAYGIFVFFFIEFDASAPVSILLLPGFETIAAIGIASYAYYKASYIKPDKSDYITLFIDVFLLVSYLVIVFLLKQNILSTLSVSLVSATFILLTSLSTITSFIPILRSTYKNPANERPFAWFVWGTAYTFLLITIISEDLGWYFFVYPILNLLLHYGLALLTFRKKREKLSIFESQIHGTGLCSSENIKSGETIDFISGEEVEFQSTNEEEAGSIPTWYGITDTLWIDPGETKFKYLNHSCDPNAAIIGKNELVARRDIKIGEEVTIDYSMTDVDQNWTLEYECKCGAKNCRKTIKSIQSLPPDVVRDHLPLIPTFFINAYKTAHPDVKL